MKTLVNDICPNWPSFEKAWEASKKHELWRLGELKHRGMPVHALHSNTSVNKLSEGNWEYTVKIDYLGPDLAFFEQIRRNAAPTKLPRLDFSEGKVLGVIARGEHHPNLDCPCFRCCKTRAYGAAREYHPKGCKCYVCGDYHG